MCILDSIDTEYFRSHRLLKLDNRRHFQRRDLALVMIETMSGRVWLRIRDEAGEEGLGTPYRSPKSWPYTSELRRPTRDHLFAMLSLTLVRLDFATWNCWTSDHPKLCQNTKISFLNRRREIVYLQVGFS